MCYNVIRLVKNLVFWFIIKGGDDMSKTTKRIFKVLAVVVFNLLWSFVLAVICGMMLGIEDDLNGFLSFYPYVAVPFMFIALPLTVGSIFCE